MCRSASQYPPNGKRCGFGNHMTTADREARRLVRNAREKELYYIRKERKTNTTETPEKVGVSSKEEASPITQSTSALLQKYADEYNMLAKHSTSHEVLSGGIDHMNNPYVSTDESRAILARLLEEEQDELAYIKVSKEDGKVGYFKKYSDITDTDTHVDYNHDVLETFNNEVVAYKLTQVMGKDYHFVPTTVVRKHDGHIGTLQAEAEGEVGAYNIWDGSKPTDFDKKVLRNVALLEYVMGAQDRHAGNFAVISEGREKGNYGITLIDNGFSLPGTDTPTYSVLVPSRAAFKVHGDIKLNVKEKKTLNKVLTSIEPGGEMHDMLSEGQQTYMKKRIQYLLKQGYLSEDNYTYKMGW